MMHDILTWNYLDYLFWFNNYFYGNKKEHGTQIFSFPLHSLPGVFMKHNRIIEIARDTGKKLFLQQQKLCFKLIDKFSVYVGNKMPKSL
jgi:hypothetical protein